MNFNLRVKGFSLQQTLLSGQSFRFDEIAPNHYLVFAWNNVVEVEQSGDELFFKNSTCHPEFWHNYFDLNYNYSNLLCGFSGDSILEIVRGFCGGIRILKQNPFEVLICFLLSSCNNIPRIKKIVSVLCRNFGTQLSCGFAFPTPQQLEHCNLNDFAILKAGFRSAYLIDAIRNVCCGNLDLSKLSSLSVDEARKKLMNIKGVGKKIADCVLLFAYHKFEVFPIDVWVKRVLQQYYQSGLSSQFLSCPGFAQQLIYYSKRSGII